MSKSTQNSAQANDIKQTAEWQVEVKHLNNTLSAIDGEIEHLSKNIDEAKADVADLREYYVRGTQIFGDIDPQERVSINERIDNLITIGNAQIDRINLLKRNRQRPYFGRVRFSAGENSDDFYVGLTGVEHEGKYFVYDWRAPICELFYDYGKGAARYRTPHGFVSGEITLKRQFEIADGKLINMFDKGANLYDEYLQNVLNKISTDKLHNIASTIQAEQNAIIRDITNDVAIVQGYAGSGKTTVALHRIAYAMYRLKDLKSANFLIFTLNDAFMSHIEGVLPELGEQNTRSATMAKFIGRLLKLPKHFEESDMFLLRYLRLNKAKKEEIAAKLDLGIKEKVKKFVEKLIDKTTAIKGFKVREIPFAAKLLNRLWTADFCDLPYFDRFDAIAGYVVKKLKADENELVFAQVKEHVLKCFNATVNIEYLYRDFCDEVGLTKPDLTLVKTEDAILMCVLKRELEDMVVKMDIRHIVIDEAQEYPALFIDLIMRLFPRAQFSIFGDKYQQTNPLGIGDLNNIMVMRSHFGTQRFYSLDNAYRSSEEIVEYASRLIGNPRHNAFRLNNGHPVVEKQIADSIEQVASQVIEILEKGITYGGTIGIITGDVESARAITTEIQKVAPHKVCLVESARSAAFAQVQVIPVLLSKGLEFNTVIVVDNGGIYDSELGKNLKFIACTRAINKLYVLQENE